MNLPVRYYHRERESIPARLTRLVLNISQRRKRMLEEVESGVFPHSPSELPASLLKRCNVTTTEFGGRTLWTLTPKTRSSGIRLLYLHGGAYTRNIIRYQWDMIARLCELTGAEAIVPDYPLAPDSSWQSTQGYVRDVWEHFMSTDNAMVIGDSAGAGLALALTQSLMSDNQPQPEQTILLSPWLDLQGNDPLVNTIAPSDPMLEPAGLRAAAELFAAGTPLNHPGPSPLYGPIMGLQGVSVFAGGNDILLPDARALKQRCSDNSLPVNYYEYPAMFHVWMAVSWLPEARLAQKQIAELICSDLRSR